MMSVIVYYAGIRFGMEDVLEPPSLGLYNAGVCKAFLQLDTENILGNKTCSNHSQRTD
jgi:hypothetical protein